MDQALDVAGNGAFGDAEFVGETPVGEPGPARVQPFDEVLLALDSSQSQMRVARCGRRPSRGLIHEHQSNHDIGVSGYLHSVAVMNHKIHENHEIHDIIAREFFDSYTRALLDRDAKAIAEHYAVPALIEFPEQAIAVSDARQTEEFFAGAFGQYEGVSRSDAAVEVVAATGHSIWADVSWHHHGGAPDERSMYQLVRNGDKWTIAVLTPLDA